MGYVVKKKENYTVKGSDGTIYMIPPREKLTVDDISLVAKYDKETDIGKKVGLCKRFILGHCPGLDKDPEIGDNEFSMIFANYLATVSAEDSKTGE